MFVEAINTASTVVSSYELSKKAVPLFGSIVRRIKNGKLNIVIAGAGGTGKSTLGKILAGDFGLENILQPYQVSNRTEEFQLDIVIPIKNDTNLDRDILAIRIIQTIKLE